MKSLIKWPGGKSSEFKYIEQFIPSYDRYIEPFFGGGAIFFNLPPGKAIINDRSKNLTLFYEFVKHKNEEFQAALNQYNDYWSALGIFFAKVYPSLLEQYMAYRTKSLAPETLISGMLQCLENNQALFLALFNHQIVGDNAGLFREIKKNFSDKVRRMIDLELKMQGRLKDEDLKDNMETGFRSGFYMHFRNLYNNIALQQPNTRQLSAAEKAANFYFIREYCYGSMFRYNSSGEFNIPYGGIAYNKKDFKKKIDFLFAPETAEYFFDTEICNMDFEACLNRLDLSENDFIFLDPPYDSDFSNYEGAAFDKSDQLRLANFLAKTSAKFILIIKKTDYVYGLYQGLKHLTIVSFDKQYAYNVRSRNNRNTKHLIITNCEAAEETDKLGHIS